MKIVLPLFNSFLLLTSAATLTVVHNLIGIAPEEYRKFRLVGFLESILPWRRIVVFPIKEATLHLKINRHLFRFIYDEIKRNKGVSGYERPRSLIISKIYYFILALKYLRLAFFPAFLNNLYYRLRRILLEFTREQKKQYLNLKFEFFDEWYRAGTKPDFERDFKWLLKLRFYSVYLFNKYIRSKSYMMSISFSTTILLAIIFIATQVYEYQHAPFSISDGIYGSIFYMLTGFHGFHVIVGTIFIIVQYGRFLAGHYMRRTSVGLETAAWYWHFVDVVWLFLVLLVYF